MLNNYFLTAWRNLTRRKGYSFINIAGLGTGLAACLVIFLILQHEFSYDRYHQKADRICELVKNVSTQDGEQHEISMPFPIATALRHEYPQVTFTELYADYGVQITVMNNNAAAGRHQYIEDRGMFFAEPTLFDLFDVHWLDGAPPVLAETNSAVLCRSLAEKYFGKWQDATGQYIQLSHHITVRIAGIIADPPPNTDFPFKLLVSYNSFLAHVDDFGYTLNDWNESVSNHQVYALLPDHAHADALDKSLPAFVTKYVRNNMQMGKTSYLLQPLANIHFDTRYENNGDHVSSRASLYTLGMIGALILFMACINFVNLSTALVMTRGKEAGVRKVMGSTRLQLVVQMLTDTALVILVSLAIALVLAQLGLPYIKYISPIEEPLHLLNKGTIFFLLGIGLSATLLSGIYPSLKLSRFHPATALRSSLATTRTGGIALRRILVVVQFAFSQLLIIATLIAVSQMQFIQDADMGVTRDAVLLLDGKNDSSFYARQPAFKQELQKLPGVKAVSLAFDAPPSGNGWNGGFSFDHHEAMLPFFANLKFGDGDYAKTFGLQMAAGQWYPAWDSTGEAVINETMCRKLGVSPENAVGRTIRLDGGNWRTIAGVVRDFKNSSLKEEVPPNIIIKSKNFHQLTAIRLQSTGLHRSIGDIETAWNRYYPEYAFSSIFLDENIARFYVQERRLSRAYQLFALLSILISSLGLYGLVSFMAVRKSKEVSIRKVLGATMGDIVALFSREFMVLIGISFLIAAPAGYYLMHRWLMNFVYRVNIGVSVFAGAILLSLVIAWITVGYRSVRAAIVNPAKNLKTE